MAGPISQRHLSRNRCCPRDLFLRRYGLPERSAWIGNQDTLVPEEDLRAQGEGNTLRPNHQRRFLEHHCDLLAQNGVAAALVDGLHTHEQTVKDVENTLRCLNEDGLIVMHDCNPGKALGSLSGDVDQEFRKANPWRFLWCGDVWKTIVHLRSTRKDLEVCVLDCDFGVDSSGGRAGRHAGRLARRYPGDVYADLARDRERLL